MMSCSNSNIPFSTVTLLRMTSSPAFACILHLLVTALPTLHTFDILFVWFLLYATEPYVSGSIVGLSSTSAHEV